MAARSSSLAKLTRPSAARVFLRERVFRLLDVLRAQQPVIWLAGPAGCGKTTLASSYVEAQQIPCLWFRLDRGDGDPASFFYYLGLAARKASPRARKPLPLLTREYLGGIPTFALRYFENLYERLKTPCMLVFDNYQDVLPKSFFHEIMLYGLSNVPEGTNIFLISRQEPHPALISLKAKGLMGVLSWNELRLTLKESSGIAVVRFRERFSQKTLQQFHNLTDGWAAGLILLLERFRREKTGPPRMDASMQKEIFNYFLSEILGPMDSGTRDFLLETAFFPLMTESMVEKLTENPLAEGMLHRLDQGNYFIEKRVLEEPVYSYHPLFREFLLSCAEERFPEARLSHLNRRAAILLEEYGQVESAIRLLRKNEDWDNLAHAILKHGPVIHAQGRDSLLGKWLQDLPPAILEARPWLSYWKGVCTMFSNPAESRPHFELAYRQMKANEDAAGLFTTWSGMVDAVNLGYGFQSFAILDRYLQELDDLRKKYPVFPTPEIEVRVSSAVVAALSLRQPDHPEFESWVERSLKVAGELTLLDAKIQALFFLAYYHNYRGNRKKAWLAIEQMRQMSQSAHASPFVKAMTLHMEAMHDCLFGLNRECHQAVRAGLELSQRTGITFCYSAWFALGGFAAFQMNELDEGRDFLKQMASCRHDLKPMETSYFYLLQANEALLSGGFQQASLHAELAYKIALDVGSPALTIRCLLVRARTLHEVGNEKDAKDSLKRAADLSRRMKMDFMTFCCLFTKAQFEFDRKEEATARVTLRKALSMGKKRGIFGVFIDRPVTAAAVCMKALEAEMEVEYVREMIRRRNLMPEQPPLHLENWPWPLKIFTLGRFRILKDEKSLSFTKKVQKKPLALLQALIALGGREVKEHRLADALWPDADGDLAHQSLAVNLHRLRQLLGSEIAIQRQENSLTLNERCCWVDVWSFEHLLEAADAHWKAGETQKAADLTEKALGYYRGPFMGHEVEQPWSMGTKERLRSMFLRSVRKLGNLWMGAGQWEKTLECYQKGLEADRLAEEFYQGLMTCYKELGRQTEVISTYNRCRKVVFVSFGIEPSSQTQSIYKAALTHKSRDVKS